MDRLQGSRRDLLRYGSLGVAISCLFFAVSNWKVQYSHENTLHHLQPSNLHFQMTPLTIEFSLVKFMNIDSK